jgi:ABC-2 type transport system permease protein
MRDANDQGASDHYIVTGNDQTTVSFRVWRKIVAFFTIWFAAMTIYRAQTIIWMLQGTAPLIMMFLWIQMAQSNQSNLHGFNARDFTAYFLAAWLSQQLIVSWVAWDVDVDIRYGNLSAKLLRPIDPIWNPLFHHITERIVRYPVFLIILIAGLNIVPGTELFPDLLHVAAYFISIFLAFGIRFMIAYCIGSLAFWVEQCTALDTFFLILMNLLAGGFAPLEFFPNIIQQIVELTPLPYLVYYPVKILNGSLLWSEVGKVFLIQGVWLICFIVLRRLLWLRGLKRYSAAGA